MYYFIFCITYLVSLLPLWLLYRLSDGLYFLLYHVAGYRKKIVFANLAQAFPEKTPQQRTEIAKKFFRNLTDLMVETIKMMSISKDQIRKRFEYEDDIFKKLENDHRAYQIQLGHFFNWEWANLYIKLFTRQPFLVTYMPLKNKATDKLFRFMRSRFGSILIPATNVLNAMQPFREQAYASVLVADQNPGRVRRAYWFPFMHKMTAFYKGPELSARRNDLVIVFGNIKKIKRGHYKIETRLAFENVGKTDKGAPTEAFVKFMEDCIREQPENWLWSHRRWKRTWKGEENN